MNTSVPTDEIDMPFAPAMTNSKRSSKERIIKKTPNNKAHITHRPVSPRREPHPAVRTKNTRVNTPRRMDIAPLPRSRLAQKPLGLRFTKEKSSWKTLLHAYMLEMSYLRDAEMWNARDSLRCSRYDQDMECEYDTMDPRFAFYMSGGVFGYPQPAFSVSTPNTNNFGSSTGSGGTVSAFSASTRSSPVGGQPGAAAVSGSSGSVTASASKPWTSDIEMEDAPDTSTDHVAATLSVATVPVPAPPLSQPPKHANTVPVAPPTFSGLGYLPSRRLTSEPFTSAKPAAMSGDQVSAKSPSVPHIPAPATAPSSAPPSQHEEAITALPKSHPPAQAEVVEPVVSFLTVANTKPAVSSCPVEDTKPAVSLIPVESTKTVTSIPSIENSKLTPTLPPVVDANVPTETSRPKSRPRGRAVVPLVEPEEASKQEVELGMGSFASSHIQSPKAQISAFSNPYFKQFFSEEMKKLKASLLKQEDIQGSQVIFLLRSLKWITDSHEGGWFEDDIELEDDVANWRGKLNILIARLETYRGPDANGIVANTRAQLEKVFVILGGAEDLNKEIV